MARGRRGTRVTRRKAWASEVESDAPAPAPDDADSSSDDDVPIYQLAGGPMDDDSDDNSAEDNIIGVG